MIIFNQAAMLTKFLLVCGPQYEGDPIQYERREISNPTVETDLMELDMYFVGTPLGQSFFF